LGVSRIIKNSKKDPIKQPNNDLYSFLPDGFSFISKKVSQMRTIYFPLCGVDSNGIKSSITPYLGGDIKVDKDRYLTKPVSVEDLRQGLRNFFCMVDGKNVISLSDNNEQNTTVEAGLLWHKVQRVFKTVGLQLEALNFVPVSGEHVELMRVTVKNISKTKRTITPHV